MINKKEIIATKITQDFNEVKNVTPVVKNETGSVNPTWKMLAKDAFRAGCLINAD